MSGKVVPSGEDYDSGRDLGIAAKAKSVPRRLLEKIVGAGRGKPIAPARMDAALGEKFRRHDGVEWNAPSVAASETSAAAEPPLPTAAIVANVQPSLPTPPHSTKPIPTRLANRSSPASELPPTGRRRPVRLSPKLVGTEEPSAELLSEYRGVWREEGPLSDREMQRKMGPIMRYDDDT